MVKVRAYLAPISSDSEKIKELQNTIDNLNEQIKGYLLNIQDLESQVNVKDSLLEAKESEINAKVLEIGELQGQITLLTSDKETMQNNIDELTTRVSQLEDEVETLNSIIEDYQSQIERKNAEIDTLINDKTSLQNQLTESNARIAELEEQLENSGSNEELEAANARIAELEGLLTESNAVSISEILLNTPMIMTYTINPDTTNFHTNVECKKSGYYILFAQFYSPSGWRDDDTISISANYSSGFRFKEFSTTQIVSQFTTVRSYVKMVECQEDLSSTWSVGFSVVSSKSCEIRFCIISRYKE